MTQYACTECGQVWTAEQLITVTNKKWVMKPTDEECCPDCRNLCIEIQPD